MRLIAAAMALISIFAAAIQSFSQGADLANRVRDIEFSMTTRDNVAAVGRTHILTCKVRNASSNEVYVLEPSWEMPWGGTVLLLSNSKHTNSLTPIDSFSYRLERSRKLSAGENSEWPEEFTLPKAVKPGDYQLTGSRDICVVIGTNKSIAKLISTPLSLKIEK